MCPPVILPALAFIGAHAAAIGTAATIGSTVLGVAGNIQAGHAAQAQATYQAEVDALNAQQGDKAAHDAIARGEQTAQAHGNQVATLRGNQTASMGAQGLELGYGTPLDIAKDTSVLANQDTQRIYDNAGREADSYRVSAANYRAQALGARAQAANAGTSMLINTGSTILGGATQLAGIQAKFGKLV